MTDNVDVEYQTTQGRVLTIILRKTLKLVDSNVSCLNKKV